MHEILDSLHEADWVLDIGAAAGSFPASATVARVVRVDLDAARIRARERVVCADACALPFPSGHFRAVIANHSLEHIAPLETALTEIGRVTAEGGALYVAVPDATTLTDRLYRWLARGGGHVNPFTSASILAAQIETASGLSLVATRTLCSSLSFLNARHAPRPRPRRLLLLGGGAEWTLWAYAWLSRRFDRWAGTRTSIYGWAFYFGPPGVPISTRTERNVCIRCGAATPAERLRTEGRIRGAWKPLRQFLCPSCGATNPFVEDSTGGIRGG